MVPKWIEKDAERFGWDNQLLDVVKNIKRTLPFKNIESRLSEFINQREVVL